MTDKIDEAIESTAEKEHDSIVSEMTWPDGTKAKIVVPIVFTTEHFETMVAALMTLRVQSEQMAAAQEPPKVWTPDKKIVGLDGKALS